MSAVPVRRWAAALAAVALLVPAVGGCGNDGSAARDLAPAAVVAQVADSMARDSARYTFTVRGSAIDVRGQGAYQGGDAPRISLDLDTVDIGAMSSFGFGDLLGSQLDGLAMRAVSYTHLTLPTKRIV